jgi:hypothetical protein
LQAIPVLSKASKVGGWFTIEDSVKPISYHEGIQKMTTSVISSGHLYTTLVQIGTVGQSMPEEFYPELLTYTRKSIPSSLKEAVVLLFPMGGKVTSSDGPETVVAPQVRQAKYFALIEARWKPNSGDAGRAAARAWCKEAARITGKYSAAVMRHAPDSIYDSSMNKQRAEDIGAHDVGYGESAVSRLQEIKLKYDPANFFCMNANISPIDSTGDTPVSTDATPVSLGTPHSVQADAAPGPVEVPASENANPEANPEDNRA